MDSKSSPKKTTAGVIATTNRLETSKPIASALRRTANGNGIPLLQQIAMCAMEMIYIIQEIEDTDIDDNFVGLTLDAFGLVYIVIHQFQKEMQRDTDLLDRMKISVVELEKNLQDILHFVEKKAHRNLAQRILKHNADEQRIEDYRRQLREWMANFGRSSQKSIHDVVEQILDNKLRRLERNTRKNKDLPGIPDPEEPLETVQDILFAPEKAAIPLAGPRSASPNFNGARKPIHIPPSITVSPRASGEHYRLPTPGLEAQRPQTADIVQRSREERMAKERAIMEAEDRKRRIFEQERARKMAERERWQRSQQQFTQLPEVTPDDLISPVASTPLPVSIIPPTPAQETPTIRPSLDIKRPLPIPVVEDEKFAAALHAEMQRELELEDKREALKYAAKLQLEREAEEKKQREGRPKTKKGKHSKSKSASTSSDGDNKYYSDDVNIGSRPSRTPSPNFNPRLHPHPGHLNGPRPNLYSNNPLHSHSSNPHLKSESPPTQSSNIGLSSPRTFLQRSNTQSMTKTNWDERYAGLS